MKKFIIILSLFFTSFTYAQITTIKVQGSGGSGGTQTLQQVFNQESGGSILTKLDTILTAGFGLRMQGTSGTSLIINNTAGTGLNITAVAGINVTAGAGAGVVASSTGSTALSGSSVSSPAVQGTSTNTFGGNFISTNGYAIHGITSTATTTFATMNLERSTAVTNTVLPLIQIQRSTSGTAANGIGTSLEFITEVSDGQNLTSNTIESVWDNATVGSRTSVLNIRGINSTASEIFAKFKTGSLVIVGNGADTLATLADVRSGGGGGNTIYTGDDDLTGNRILGLAGFDFSIKDGSNEFIGISPSGFNTTVYGQDGTATTSIRAIGDAVGGDVYFRFRSNDGVGADVEIKGDAVADTMAYTAATQTFNADSIRFNSTLSGTSNGYVWTLANSALGTGYWAAGSSGTVTSVATGLGLSGGTITTTGTLLVDTSSASILSRQRAAATYATLSGLGAYLPLAGGTMVGNIIATDNTYDLGASGATRFRTAYLGTSLMVPAINGGSAANDDITIQGTTSATRTTSYVNLQPTAGSVGIGVTAPASILSIVGGSSTIPTVAVGGNLTQNDFQWTPLGNEKQMIFSGASGYTGYGDLVFGLNNLDSASQTMGYLLWAQKVTGKSGSSPGLKAAIGVTSSGAGGTTGGYGGNMIFYTRPNNNTLDPISFPRMTIDLNGNVGVGQATPLTQLHVGGLSIASVATPTQIRMDGSYAASATPTNQQLKLNLINVSATEAYGIAVASDAGMWYWSGDNASTTAYHAFSAGGAERMRVGANGRVGIGVTSPTAVLHIKAGTTAANTAPEKNTAGSLLTTIEALTTEVNASSFYRSTVALNRYAEGGVIADFTADVNNSGTGETDLLTYTTKANSLVATGEKLIFNATGTFNDLTATSQLQFYFGGTNIGNTGALTVSATGGWTSTVTIIRTGSTTARATVNLSTPGASTAVYTTETDITGLTFSNTNIIKVTGTAGGASGGSSDITAKMGFIMWWGAANN